MGRINWIKTKRNINDRLCDLAYKKQLAEYMGLGEQSAQRMLNEKNDRIINHEELVHIALFLQCEVDDLVIYETDKYVETQFKKGRIEPELKKTEKVKIHANMAVKIHNEKEIRDLYEFLLYLPLMNAWSFGAFIDKSLNNLNTNKEYIREKLNDLYKCIPDTPEKDYADWYRDNILRVKGDTYARESAIKDEWDWDANKAYDAKVREFAEFCMHCYGIKMK